VVINKTVVYAGLAGFITAVYVAIVVGLGALVGEATSKPNLGLSILATAVVAVAFQPVRNRVQRLANRLVYGERATPYEVLSEFSSRMANSYTSEESASPDGEDPGRGDRGPDRRGLAQGRRQPEPRRLLAPRRQAHRVRPAGG
jgi:hypothetical protein